MRDDTLMMEPQITVMKTPVKVGTRGKSADIGLLFLRLAVGGLMIFHGIAKLTSGVEMMKPMLSMNGLPEWLIYGLYIAEVLAPLMIIFGFRTRLAALTIIFDMIMAVILVHTNDIFSLNRGGGWAIEIEAFYFLTALALFFTGGGRHKVFRSLSVWD